MPLLVYNNCCCCVQLRTGSFIMAYIMLVVYFNLFVLSLIGLPIAAFVKGMADDDESMASRQFGLVVANVCPLMFSVVALVFTIVLHVGLHKRKRVSIYVFLIVMAVFVVLDSLFTVLHICYFFSKGISFFFIRPTTVLCARVVIVAINIYGLIVIRRYYLKMAEEDADTNTDTV